MQSGPPYEKSFNAAIASMMVETPEKSGHTVKFRDL